MRIITLFVVALMLLASNLLAADYLTPASAESVPEDQPSALPVLPLFSLPGRPVVVPNQALRVVIW